MTRCADCGRGINLNESASAALTLTTVTPVVNLNEVLLCPECDDAALDLHASCTYMQAAKICNPIGE